MSASTELQWRLGSMEEIDKYISIYVAKTVEREDGEFDVEVDMLPTARINEFLEGIDHFVWAPVPYSVERCFDKAADILFEQMATV